MPALSVIVPVHNVEDYVAACLESILDQDFDDVEVIVIDDASTDGSARVVEETVKGNDKVHFIRLAENVGLGFARNEGLKVATGDYLLFVDSDDWIERGSLKAIAQRASTTEADVVVFDYAKSHLNGVVRRNAKQRLLQAEVPDVFDLHQHPDLLELLMVVWNKAYRREFIERLGLRFYKGYYEDLPWTYPVLMAADRIALLNRVCYYYRQRPSGNILRTSGRRHFDLFDQYTRVFAFIDAHPELEEWRPTLLKRMMQHLLFVLNTGDIRIPANERSNFVAGVADVAKRVTNDVEWPPLRFEERLLRQGSYRGLEAVRLTNRIRGPVRKLRKRIVARGQRWQPRLHRLAYAVARRMPLDPNLALFYSYWGRGYSCNPAAIYEKLHELKPDVKAVWIVNAPAVPTMPAGVECVVPNTFRYFVLLAQATYFVGNVGFPSEWKKRNGQMQVMTHHGTALKTMGLDLKDYPVAARNINFTQHMKRVNGWDYSIASSRYSEAVWRRVYPGNYEPLPFGQPRNDLFFTATDEDQRRIRAELGIAEDKVAVLYTPTFRDWERPDEVQLDLERFADRIGSDFVILARSHY